MNMHFHMACSQISNKSVGLPIIQIQIQIQTSLLLPIYIVMIIYDAMDTMYMYFSGTIS